MSDDIPSSHVLVVGGGIAGLLAAVCSARRGLSVVLVDARLPGRASPVAAGMLAPWSEYERHEAGLLPLMVDALAAWPLFAESMGLSSDARPRSGGTLVPALEPEDEHHLAAQVAHLRAVGARPVVVDAAECRRREPALSPSVRAGVVLDAESSVDNRSVLAALTRIADELGVERRATVAPLHPPHRTEQDPARTGRLVVHADGAFAARHRHADVRPVQGVTIRVEAPGIVRHMIRARTRGRSLYLVPRATGEVVIGASSTDVGFDTAARAGIVHDLLGDAFRVVPALRDAAITSIDVGLRPISRTGMPHVGVDGSTITIDGLGRHGFLLAPWLVERLDDVLPRKVHA